MVWTFAGSLDGYDGNMSWEIGDIQQRLTIWMTLKSHRFRFGGRQWGLAMVRGETRERQDIVQLLFRFDDMYGGSDVTPFVLRWSAAIVDRDGLMHYTGSGEANVDIEDAGWTTVARWHGPAYEELFRTPNEGLLPGGKITITTHMTCESIASIRKDLPVFFNEFVQTDVGDAAGRRAGLASLGQNLKDLYLAGKDCDVTLKVSEKTFRAHKLILRSRTPVLSAMFSHGMAEAETGVVCVEDCHPEAFEVFLVYVYSGVAENLSVENVIHVYYVADKYDLSGLREDCIRYMLSNLSIDCICSVLALAARHGEEGLLESGAEFFVKKAEEIFLTDAWRNFKVENSTLADDLIARTCGKTQTK